MINIKCHQCGKTTSTYPSRRTSKKFCSRTCMMKSLAILARQRKGSKHQNWRKRQRVHCANCGRLIFRRPSGLYNNCCCNDKCRNEWNREVMAKRVGPNNPCWLGGSPRYRGPRKEWVKASKAAIRRDGGKCQRCRKPSTAVHHKVPFRLFCDWRSANDLSNLECLCASCHRKTEAEYWRSNKRIIDAKKRISCCKCGAMFESHFATPKRICPKCRIYTTCRQCGTKIDLTSRRRRTATFCSWRCAGLFNSVHLRRYWETKS